MRGGEGESCGPNWSAFWLNGADPGVDSEIDVMECLSRGDAALALPHHQGEPRRISA
jgi:hypothetical protein